MKKTFWIISSLTFVSALIFGISAFFLFFSPKSKTNDFFELLKEDKVSEAYKLSSKDFQNNTPEDQLQLIRDSFFFGNFEKISTKSWKFNLDKNGLIATFSGRIDLNKDSGDYKIQLIQESEKWKISYFEIKNIDQATFFPTETEIQKMSKTATKDFVESVYKWKLDEFQVKTSRFFQKDISIADFEKNFDSLKNFEGNVEFRKIYTGEYKIKNTETNEKGEYEIDGIIEYNDVEVEFKYGFLPEKDSWAINSISFYIYSTA